MSFDLLLQAIPEDCEPLRRARIDLEIAQQMEFLHFITDERHTARMMRDPLSLDLQYFYAAAQELLRVQPDLFQRFLYAGRRWDQLIYLLSPARRAEEFDDISLIVKAIKGIEWLHPEARATQGLRIGFVTAHDVHVIAEFLDAITIDQLHEHYNPVEMAQHAVYKIHAEDDEVTFGYIWNEFVAIRNEYHETAVHNEAMITVLD